MSSYGNDEQTTKPKISYRSAKPTDVPAIARLLTAVFDDDDDDATNNGISSEIDKPGDDSNKTFMWDSLTTENTNDQQSPEQQREFIERQLVRRMADARKEGSLPHSCLVATIPNSSGPGASAGNDRLIGFIEIGTLPSPFGGKVEMPYIGNVAVADDVRRRKVGSTLVGLATRIATKWCTPPPGSKTALFPPFLFLSVERDNRDALLFYERLGFEEIDVGKKPSEKIYLATEIADALK